MFSYLLFIICPSFPGDEQANVSLTNEMGRYRHGQGVSNYIALAATHYVTTGSTARLAGDAGGNHAGNSALVFPLLAGSARNRELTRRGLPLSALRDGTSHTVLFTESREQGYANWLSGMTYGVGVWPRSVARPGDNRGPDGFFGWSLLEVDDPLNRLALNVGTDKPGEDAAAGDVYYFSAADHPHGARARRWGPSSAHAGGVVLHAYSDGHITTMSVDVDKNAYLRLLTRRGGEPATQLQ